MPTFSETTDISHLFTQTFLLNDGDRFEGQLAANNDVDVIAVNMTTNLSYYFEFNQELSSPDISVFDEQGVEISSFPSGVAGNISAYATPPEDGVYYIQVHGSLFDNIVDTGSYAVNVVSEVVDTINTQAEIIFDYSDVTSSVGSYSGDFEHAQDTDFIRVELDTGFTYNFVETNSSSQVMYFGLQDDLGNTISRDDSNYSTSDLGQAYTVAESGTYYLVATVDVNNNRPFLLANTEYGFDVRVEPTWNANTNYSIAPGETISGQWNNFRDVDWYEVELEAGTSYLVYRESGELTSIGFVDARGAGADTTSHDFGSRSYEAITPNESGTYYVAIAPSPGTYSATLLQEVAGDTSTSSTLGLGETESGAFEFHGDDDFYSVDLVGGQTYEFTVDLNDVSPSSFFLYFYDSNGDRLSFHLGEDEAAQQFLAPSTGEYFVNVSQHSNLSSVANDYTLSLAGVGVNVEGTDVSEPLNGTDFNDTIVGLGGDDTIVGGLRADLLRGGAGADSIQGGAGRDTVQGGGGQDTLQGGNGRDVVRGGDGIDLVRGGNGNDRVSGGTGDDQVFGGKGLDTLLGDGGNDRIYGEGGRDDAFGGSGNDLLSGGAGADTLFGNQGKDRLLGGAGDDSLNGNKGNDTLNGGTGNDSLFGGLGFDDFVFSGDFGNDTISDFDAGDGREDINLSRVSSITDYTDLTNNHMRQVGANVVIDDGNGNTITLLNTALGDLSQNDFIL